MASDDFSKVFLAAPDGARAEIYHYGAHVTSWITPDGRERLFLSRATEFRPGVAMRGGIPVVFPQFSGNGPLPKHGFARTTTWDYLGEEGSAARFRLSDSEATRRIWDHPFRFDLTVTVSGQRLEVSMQATNTGTSPFEFTAALHTYFRVADIANVRIEGLEKRPYTEFGHDKVQAEPELRIEGEVDRVYWKVPGPVTLHEGDQSLRVEKTGFPDVVVWNPGKDKGDELTDLEPGGYRRMVCIEAVVLGQPVHLAPGGTWHGSQIITAG